METWWRPIGVSPLDPPSIKKPKKIEIIPEHSRTLLNIREHGNFIEKVGNLIETDWGKTLLPPPQLKTLKKEKIILEHSRTL